LKSRTGRLSTTEVKHSLIGIFDRHEKVRSASQTVLRVNVMNALTMKPIKAAGWK
jgi:hypothetical protein